MTNDNEVTILPDGSAFATMSFPLPKDHWLYAEGLDAPPMPFRMGTSDPDRKLWEQRLRVAGQYAVRGATMNGKDTNFDPDALIQNLIVGFLGYHTEDGLSHMGEDDSWMNPHPTPGLRGAS